MSFTVEVALEGDGRQKAEETVAAAIRGLITDARVKAYLAAHPNLKTVTAESLLGTVSRKRGARLIETGIFDEEDTVLNPERVIPRGRKFEARLPFPVLLAGLDLLPPVPGKQLPPVNVLYEDSEWLAIDKPHDIPSAPIRSDETDSAVHRALLYFPGLPVMRGNPLEPGLVHRLDNGTGGVLLFSKTVAGFERLEKEWNTGRVRKIYRAICPTLGGGYAKLPARADLLMGHDEKSKKRMRVQVTPSDAKRLRGEAMAARTELLAARPTSQGMVDVEVKIETGIHHQIRATLAHLGSPILGDSVYGGAPANRLWLQAWKLSFPVGTKEIEVVATLPSDWPKGSQ